MTTQYDVEMVFREATQADLPALVAMLADDALGAAREDNSLPLNPGYVSAFSSIDSDSNNELVVIDRDQAIIGMLQLTFIPYLTHTGSWRCLIEGVRVHADYRGMGLGRQLFEWAIDRARSKDCAMVQLTSNKQRPEAIRFYHSLGFVDSHEGFKLALV